MTKFASFPPAPRSLRGFTLIELLIVVAIIAILAAIAVPNFLEAQTRAKVSRVKSDHRSIALALEAYQVDNNKVPLTRAELIAAGVNPADLSPDIHFIRLTTPVAYMTSIPLDPFSENGAILASGPALGRTYYEYITMYRDGGLARRAFSRGYVWAMISIGPSRSRVDPTNNGSNVTITQVLGANNSNQPLFVYDPTNGTVSIGYIWRTNKGIYTGEDFPRN
jgi:type II secretion system protein G